MRGLWTSIVVLAGMTAAAAQPALRNVTGLDPTLLAGKTCRGVFNTGRGREGSQGALQLRFLVQGDVLTGHFWRQVSKSAYDQAAYAITQPGQRSGRRVTGLDYLGEVSGLTVTGNTIRYVDPIGGRV